MDDMRRIIRNAIKCNHCGEVIESKYTHDFKGCKCGCVYVDGGLDYLRRGFKNGKEDYEELAEFGEENDFNSLLHVEKS
jgi:tRNA(Ile2) C34 agmatinyltransferase TiaS